MLFPLHQSGILNYFALEPYIIECLLLKTQPPVVGNLRFERECSDRSSFLPISHFRKMLEDCQFSLAFICPKNTRNNFSRNLKIFLECQKIFFKQIQRKSFEKIPRLENSINLGVQGVKNVQEAQNQSSRSIRETFYKTKTGRITINFFGRKKWWEKRAKNIK